MSGGFMLPVPTQLFNETAQSTTYLAKAADFVVATGTWTLTLPVTAGAQVVVQNAGAGVITLSPASGKLNGPGNWNVTTLSLSKQGDFAMFVGDGTNANLIAGSGDIIGSVSGSGQILGTPIQKDLITGFTITSTTAVALDTSNYRLTFTPTGPSILLHVEFTWDISGTSNGAWIDIMNGATVLKTMDLGELDVANVEQNANLTFVITGLTAGTPISLDLGAHVGAGTLNIYNGLSGAVRYITMYAQQV